MFFTEDDFNLSDKELFKKVKQLRDLLQRQKEVDELLEKLK